MHYFKDFATNIPQGSIHHIVHESLKESLHCIGENNVKNMEISLFEEVSSVGSYLSEISSAHSSLSAGSYSSVSDGSLDASLENLDMIEDPGFLCIPAMMQETKNNNL